MLCPGCHRRLEAAGVCPRCGGGRAATSAVVLELVLADRVRVPLLHDVTIGRAPGSTLRLDDPAVSCRQARISVPDDGRVFLEDAGSSFGTWLDGRRVEGREPLRDGSRIRIGDRELVVERRRDESEAGRTVVVRPGESLVMPAAGSATPQPPSGAFGTHPRVRPGYALKRLDASEGERRWILRDLESNRSMQMTGADAALFELLDGRRSLAELINAAGRRDAAGGPARLARLLTELADRGLLAGVGAPDPAARADPGRLRKLATPKEWTWAGAGALFDRLYRRGAWRLFTRPAPAAIAALVVAGLVAFPYLVIGGYGTPFVVAHKVAVGALIFLLGRLAVVAVHETAHGLTMTSFGRRVRRAGLKVLLIFPYPFVDTSEAWFEPPRRRIEIRAAGPVSDFSMGAVFSLCCLALPSGTIRDIFFQLAFAAYVGGCLNLNPFVERDGYHILVDLLRQPGLRRRAREQMFRRMSGRGDAADSGLLTRYAATGLGWSAVTACFAAGMSWRYRPSLAAVAREPVAWAVLAALGVAFLLPVVAVLAGPLRARWRSSEA
ncbi:MAG: putative peptide zinc metalloprotease protein [Solirubrobacteraceae bacterium]|nr:putative peptide zinc metalloprotease protein [Solirubrobacteraceae bacterium]